MYKKKDQLIARIRINNNYTIALETYKDSENACKLFLPTSKALKLRLERMLKCYYIEEGNYISSPKVSKKIFIYYF